MVASLPMHTMTAGRPGLPAAFMTGYLLGAECLSALYVSCPFFLDLSGLAERGWLSGLVVRFVVVRFVVVRFVVVRL